MNRVKAQCVTSAKPRAMSEVRVQPVTGISVQGVTRIQFSVDQGLDCSPDSDWSGRGMRAVTDNGTQHGAGARAAEGQLRPCGGLGATALSSLHCSAPLLSPSRSFKNHPLCDRRCSPRSRLKGRVAAVPALRFLPSPRGSVKFVVQEAPRPRTHQGSEAGSLEGLGRGHSRQRALLERSLGGWSGRSRGTWLPR